MERYTSHPEEQYFGRYRDHVISFNILANAFSYAIRASLALDFEHDLNVSFMIPKRENFGGAHWNFYDSKGNTFDNYLIFKGDIQIDIYKFSNNLFKCGTGKKIDKASLLIIHQLCDFFEFYKSYSSNLISLTKGIGIVPRIINSGKFDEHDKCMKKTERKSIQTLYHNFEFNEEDLPPEEDFEKYSDSDFYEYDDMEENNRKNIHLHNNRH